MGQFRTHIPSAQCCSALIITHVALHLALHCPQYACQVLGLLCNHAEVWQNDQSLAVHLQQWNPCLAALEGSGKLAPRCSCVLQLHSAKLTWVWDNSSLER